MKHTKFKTNKLTTAACTKQSRKRQPCCNTSRATWSKPSEPPHMKPFFEVLSFSAVFGTAGCCCQLVCFEFGVLHLRLPMDTRNGQVGEDVLPLWYLALVLAGCCCQFVCFEFVVLRFRLNGQIVEHVRTEKKQKRPCPAVQGTWLHVGPIFAGVLTHRFST